MGLYDATISSVSGLTAFSNNLSTIGQNISNLSTVGYKRSYPVWQTMANQPNWSKPAAGGVTMKPAMAVAQQGALTSTTSSTDLAVTGNGFFVVQDAAGKQYLTRSGSFVPDANGNLINSNGFWLMAYGASGSQGGDSLSGMQMVNVGAATTNSVTVGSNGTLSYQNTAGATVTPYHIPLANVISPQNLQSDSGNVFSLTEAAGDVTVGPPRSGSLGTIGSGSLEQSTVDVATELSNMISAQFGYQSNGQALKASTDMMKTLVGLNI
jgi:flagellar hook protein FlgE